MSEGVDRGKRQPDTRGEPVEQAGIAGQTAPTPAEGIFEALIASAQESGQLASDELAVAVDELELEPAQVEELYGRLEELHIEVVEPVEEEAEAVVATAIPPPRAAAPAARKAIFFMA